MSQSFSPPYTPEHNAIAERINRTLCDAARSLLIQASLPSCLWPFALKHVIYVRNRVQHFATGKSPFEVVTNRRPNLKHIRVFGCTAYVLQLPRPSKFSNRAIEGVYLETVEHGIFKVLVMEEDKSYRIIESRHVTFNKNEFLGAPGLEDIMDDEISDDDIELDMGEDHNNNTFEVTQQDDLSISFNTTHKTGNNQPSSSSNENQLVEDNPSALSNASSTGDSEEENEGESGGDKEDNVDSENQNEDDESENDNSNITEETDQSIENRRYPSRNRNPPAKWYVASTIQDKSHVNVKITTSDISQHFRN